MRWRRLEWPGWARRAVAASYAALLTGALLAPPAAFEDVDRLLAHQDKLAHVGLFLTLALLVRWSLPREGGRPRRVALVALALYALAIEALQPQLTAGQRLFEAADLVCNCAGLCAGWVLFPAMTAR